MNKITPLALATGLLGGLMVGLLGSSTAWAGEAPKPAQSVETVATQWRTVAGEEKSMVKAKQAKAAQMVRAPAPKVEPLQRFQDHNGDWVIGHRTTSVKPSPRLEKSQ